jgi:hypothetical protein
MFKIVKASRYFVVYPTGDEAIRICQQFQLRYKHEAFTHYLDRDKAPEPPKMYAIGLSDNSEFRYHRNTLGRFLVHLKDKLISDDKIEITEKELPDCEVRDIKAKSHWVIRDYQKPIIEYLYSATPVNKFVGVQPGSGKTLLSLLSVAKLGLRTVIIVEGGFVTKWASDILEVLDIPAKRTMCVRGGNQLRGLIGMRGTKEFEKIDILLISSQTFQEWISMHETMVTKNHRDVGYGIEPSEFYEELEIGHRVIDEVHRRFHFNYKMDLYANPHRVTSLSATLVSYDKVMEGLYEVAYPKLERYNGGEVDKYTLAKSVIWDSYNPKKLKTKEFNRNTYSHTAFEKSIMRNALTAERYFEMISETLDIGYIANYKPGNKAAIYVATTDMATAMVAYLRKRFAGKSVERYVSTLKDPYSNLLDPDIRVSTLGSGGTGHDIKGLTDTLLTVVIQSLQANIQVFGRTRFIPDQDTRFWYFSCSGLDQHMKYHKDKVKLMNDRAKDFEILNYGIPI